MGTDRFTVRAIVVGLIVIALFGIAALTYALAAVDLAPEQRGTVLGVLGSLTTGAIGAIGGLLARTQSEAPQTAVSSVTTTTTAAPADEPPTQEVPAPPPPLPAG